ncbi:MAG: isoprenylcysteine carboxylmethyltransferase family protein [Dysgonamonadaceae bacterium]|jgi:protein-S-isoprenylcysteine O-methyltransferase Ste14|nr:isoprenylcysteine carboxylmethyltransferase family protein [Dysgonamonadaceae bacterium]
MNDIAYKILLAALVIAMNLIRMYYQKRYKQTHATTESEIAPKREKLLTQMMALALAVPGMIWLFTGWLSFGQYALPDSVRIAGFAVGVYGIWWFYRIHKTLGDNWSPVLEIRRKHTLITAGPYKRVRHPMYSNMMLWLVSFALITANWFYALTISTGLVILLSVRIPDEEKLMIERFGEQYREYMKRTKRLIPFIF